MSSFTDIATYFKTRQYSDCFEAIKLAEATTKNDVEKLVIETNALVCQLMEEGRNEECIESLVSLARKTCLVPLIWDRSFRLLLLQLSSNLTYLLLVSKSLSASCIEPLLTLLLTCLSARGTHYGPEVECLSSPKRQLSEILEKLAAVENTSPEANLLNYMKTLLFLLDGASVDSSYALCKGPENEYTADSVTRLPLLLFSPLHLGLAVTHEDVSQVDSFSCIVTLVANFDTSEVQVLTSPCDKILQDSSVILKALQLLKRGRPEQCAVEIAALNYEEKSSPSSLAFLKHVVSAAALSALGQSSLALQHLRITVGNRFAIYDHPCAAALIGIALQFGQLNQKTEELESWQLALDCVSQVDSTTPGIHDDFPGYLFSHLGIFTVDMDLIRYSYSRRLLELKEYGKAAQLYEDTLSGSFDSSLPWTLFGLKPIPAESVRLREYLICLFMSSKYRKVVDVCDQHYLTSEDFVVPFVDGLARARQGQWKEALKSLNKYLVHSATHIDCYCNPTLEILAVTTVNSQMSLPDEVYSAVLCQLQLNRSQVLEQLQWFQDCFHALRLALQASPLNAQVAVYYDKFCRQHGFGPFAKLDSTSTSHPGFETDDIVLQWVLSETAVKVVK